MNAIIHHWDQNAHAIVRFGYINVVAVYDERPKLNGVDTGEFLGIGKNGLRITNDFSNVLETPADIIITTGEGQYFTKKENVFDWKTNVERALKKGINVYSMSKILYGEKTEKFRTLAKENNTVFEDASDPDIFSKYEKYLALLEKEPIKTPVVCITGTSMNSGKLTAQVITRQKLEERGLVVGLVGTEPSAKFIGCDEQIIPEVMPAMRGAHAICLAIKKVECEKKPDIILVAGQTGLRASVRDISQSRAGAIVAWQILLGSNPDKVVLCSKWSKTDEIEPHIALIKHSIGKDVCTIIINGCGCEKEKLMNIVSEIEDKTGILTLDILATPEKITQYVDAIKN